MRIRLLDQNTIEVSRFDTSVKIANTPAAGFSILTTVSALESLEQPEHKFAIGGGAMAGVCIFPLDGTATGRRCGLRRNVHKIF